MKITKTKSGKWTTHIAITGADGKRHYKTFTHKNKGIVAQMAADYKVDHALYIESMALKDALTRFIDSREQILSPSTIHGYKANQRVLEEKYASLNNKSIDRITTNDLQDLIDDMKLHGKSVKSMRNRISLICTVIKAEGFRPPVYHLPHEEIKEKTLPEPQVMQQICTAAKGTRMELPLALAIFGLRRGEICAVNSDDLNGNTLHVCRAIAVDDDGFSHVKDPKTKRSDRYILLPDSVCELLREQGVAWKESPSALTLAWPHLLIKAKIPEDQRFRLHDCRAFFASYCHEVLHLSDEQIMQLGGWSTDSIMKRNYRRVLTSAQQVAAVGFAGFFG